MIIISDKYSPISIEIPCNLAKGYINKYALELRHTVTNRQYNFIVEDENTSDFFYNFKLDLSKLPSGEYIYSVNGSKGLLRIASENEVKEYETEMKFKCFDATI